MAAPHVAGAAALYLARRPDASPAQVRQALVGAATKGVVSDARRGSPNVLLHTATFTGPVATTAGKVSGAATPAKTTKSKTTKAKAKKTKKKTSKTKKKRKKSR
jgi:subtilisin family serine protease